MLGLGRIGGEMLGRVITVGDHVGAWEGRR